MKQLTIFLILTYIPFSILGQERDTSFWKPYVDEEVKELNLDNLNNTHYKTAFRIGNSYQVIELINENDTLYRGQLINYVTKINRDEKKKRLISQTLTIPESVTKALINQLLGEGIELLPDSYDVAGYINGLDGNSYQFEIGSEGKYRIYSYWEPENNDYQNPEIEEVKKVRKILNALNQQFDLWKLFIAFRDQLPYGRYQYGMIILTKR
jgi:hypothetical protein